MEKADDIAASIQFQGASKPTMHSQATWEETRKAIAIAWRTLASWKLVHGAVGETDHRLWEAGLQDLLPSQIERGVLRSSNFDGYFSIAAFKKLCQQPPEGVKDAKAAYIEACNVTGAKKEFKYSHPIVYHAGVETGWFDLHNKAEKEIFPLYRYNYERLLERLGKGESFDTPIQKALPETITRELTKDEQKAKLKEMMKKVGL